MAFFRSMATALTRQIHVRPVMVASFGLTTVGTYWGLLRATTGPEYAIQSYVDQNAVDVRSLIERELNAELYLILTTPLEQIPVAKRHVWQMAGECEKIFDQLQNNTLPVTDEQIDQQHKLYTQWLSQTFDLYFTLAEQRGYYTPEQRRYIQTRNFAIHQLPPAVPFKIRPFPDINQPYVNKDITPPAVDAPREDFVKYYALKYNVDL